MKAEASKNPNLKIDAKSVYQNLVGQQISSGTILVDPVDNTEKIFFIFPDLAVRTAGEYKFHFSLMNMNMYF